MARLKIGEGVAVAAHQPEVSPAADGPGVGGAEFDGPVEVGSREGSAAGLRPLR